MTTLPAIRESPHDVGPEVGDVYGTHQGPVNVPAGPQHQKQLAFVQFVDSNTSSACHGLHQGVVEVCPPPASHVPAIETSVTVHESTERYEQSKVSHKFNPEATSFRARDSSLVHKGVLIPDLGAAWEQVQRVQHGGVGDAGIVDTSSWNASTGVRTGQQQSSLREIEVPIAELLPFQFTEDIPALLGIAPKQVYKVNCLQDQLAKLPCGRNFFDKVLPASNHELVPNLSFTVDYLVALHNIVSAAGIRGDGTSYPAYTPNHLGARVPLPHVKLKIDRWRHHLVGYEHVEIIQHLEYGFPVGLNSLPDLESSQRNHGSAYQWYSHVDKFICTEVKEGGMTGPFSLAPWWNTVVSPLMTAHKKPLSRRTVFDATFGEKSLNNATPSDLYMGQPAHYTFPKIEDFKEMILKSGKGAYMWKRDLSRFFLQLPLDPTEYHRVAVIWRGFYFFFIGLAFGLRHSGLNGQRTTDAVSWILRGLGRDSGDCTPFQVVNYVDDTGGVEKNEERAGEAFDKMGSLLVDLGLEESKKKAEPPSTKMTFLGVEFDSKAMTMSVPPSKLTEIKAEIGLWLRRTTINKKELQSLLGKLFWVAKCVKYARVFMGRLLDQLRTMSSIKDTKKIKLKEESRKDILWWSQYLEHYNGINLIVNENPIPLSFEQLLDKPYDICAGDATPTGGGAWHGKECWCGELPLHLKDTQIPIHIKEFWIVIVSAKLWGDSWSGRCIVIYCDNDAVCDTIQYKKPRDLHLLSLLREFLYVVVSKKFFPVLRKIGTKENKIADFISRRFDRQAASKVFSESGLHEMDLAKPNTNYFNLSSNW